MVYQEVIILLEIFVKANYGIVIEMMLKLIEKIRNYSKPNKTKYECSVNGKIVETRYSKEENPCMTFRKFRFSSGDCAKIIITNLETNIEKELILLV